MRFWGAHEFRHTTKNRPLKIIPHEDCTAGIRVPGKHLGSRNKPWSSIARCLKLLQVFHPRVGWCRQAGFLLLPFPLAQLTEVVQVLVGAVHAEMEKIGEWQHSLTPNLEKLMGVGRGRSDNSLCDPGQSWRGGRLTQVWACLLCLASLGPFLDVSWA